MATKPVMQFCEDDVVLNSIPAVSAQAVSPAAAPAPIQSKPAANGGGQPPAPPADALASADEDFDPAQYSGFLGKLKVPLGTVARLAVLGPVARGFRHYHEQSKQYILCASKRDKAILIDRAACCEHLGDAKFAVAALAWHYTLASPKDGKLTTLESAAHGSVAALVVPAAGWGSIKNGVPEGGKLTDFDVKAWPRSNGFGLEFGVQASSQAAWKRLPADVQRRILAEAERLKSHLASRIGKTLTPAQIKALVSLPARDEENFDDVMSAIE